MRHMYTSITSDEDQTTTLCDISSSRTIWKNLSTLSSIKWTRLNGNDFHPSISSKPLIEDEEAHQTVMPNFAYICMFLYNVKHSWMFRVIELFGYLNP